MAANKQRTNTPTEQNKDDNTLVLYRLKLVEDAVKDVSGKLDRQDNIKKSDLIEFRDTILTRVNEIQTGLQRQIDDKADQSQVDDLRGLVKAVGTALLSIIVGLSVYFITRK